MSHDANDSAPILNDREIRVFTTYSHRDLGHKQDIHYFLEGLERHGFTFWSDERIETGELWDDEIRKEIANSQIALALVSQYFLNSEYCRNVEIAQFIQRRKRDGLIIYPIILSPCSWAQEDWLSSTQYQPRGGKTVEEHYNQRGKRKRLYLTVHDELLAIARRMND